MFDLHIHHLSKKAVQMYMLVGSRIIWADPCICAARTVHIFFEHDVNIGCDSCKPRVAYNRRGTRLIWNVWRLTRYAHYRRTPISPSFNQSVEAARPVSPQVSIVAPFVFFLPDCSGLLPIPGHVIGVSRRRR